MPSGIEGGAIYALSGPLREAILRDGAAAIDDRPAPRPRRRRGSPTRLAKRRKGETLSNHLRKAAGLSPAAIALLREGAGAALPRGAGGTGRADQGRAAASDAAMAPIERAISTAGGVARHRGR